MVDRLEAVVDRHRRLSEELTRPDVLSDHTRLARLGREQRQLQPLVDAHAAYQEAESHLHDAREMLRHERDPDMQEFLRAEERSAEQRLADLQEEIKILLLPRDPNDDRDVIVEIQAAEGGQEAALFASDLFRMYTRWADAKGWRVDVLEAQETGIGGYDKVEFEVRGEGAYSQLKYEGGVHRVQRVPATESQGRVHTSAVQVVVMPEADELEVDIPESDLDWKTSTSQGHGGQSVNTTYSKVILTHRPTGIVVSMQDERSQLQNREKALRVLRARLYELELARRQAEVGEIRRSMAGTGNRSEKIRTYNFKDNRVTDRRLDVNLYKLDRVLQGDLDELIGLLVAADRAQLLAAT
jgi:peptide chain release factor 1